MNTVKKHKVERREYTQMLSGLKFHVTEWGNKNGYPMVMLHGIRGYSETFAHLAATLQPDIRAIAYDQRGRGKSDWDPNWNYYTDTYVSDIEGIVDALGLEQFHLLGHSMGGINAIVYAARHPQRVNRLIIEDAGPGAFDASAGATRIRKEFSTTPDSFESWDAASDFMRALRPTVTEDARQQRLHSMLKSDSDGNYTWRYDHKGIATTRLKPDPSRVVDLVPYVKALKCKALVIRGARSDYLQPEMMQRMCDLNACISAIDIPDAGHYIHDDQPELFSHAVSQFLKEE